MSRSAALSGPAPGARDGSGPGPGLARLAGWLLLAAGLTACTEPPVTSFQPPRVVKASAYREQGDFEAIARHKRLRLLMVRHHDTVTRLPRPGTPVYNQMRAATRFARSVGIEPVVVLVDHTDDLTPALKAGRGDVIVANLPITSQPRQQIAFTVALDRNHQTLVARADDPIDSPDELSKRSITVAFGSRFWKTAQRLQKEHPGLKVKSRPALTTKRAMDLLTAGKIDLTIADSNVLDPILEYRDHLRAAFPVSADEGVAWGVRPQAGELRKVLNRFIRQRQLAQFNRPQRTGDLATIKRHHTLRVATRNSAVNYFVWRGRMLGFEYELTKRFADQLGVSLRIVTASPGQSLRQLVRSGQADMAAAFLHRRGDARDHGIAYSKPYHEAADAIITTADDHSIQQPADLAGRTVRVKPGSHAWHLVRRLQQHGIDVRLKAVADEQTPETMIRKVASGTYDLTLVGIQIARNARAWNTRIATPLQLGAPVAHRWAFRTDNDQLREAANQFIRKIDRSAFYNVLYAKYFRDHKRIRAYQAQRVDLTDDHQLSPFDDIIKAQATKQGFDWRLIAAQIFQESGFQPQAKSWAGARGLMQVRPQTAQQMGVTGDLTEPRVNIRAGMRYLAWLREHFEDDLRVQDRMWFTLAAFNAGLGHLRDARHLADRLGLDPDRWFGNVAVAMRKLGQAKYYRNARFGYVRGSEPVHYVRAIRDRYQAYILWTNNCWPSCQTSPHPQRVEIAGAESPTAGRHDPLQR